MATFEQISVVMAQIGERLNCQGVTEYAPRKSWIVLIDDATAVEIAFDDRNALLHMTSPVGDLPQYRRQPLAELLLRYNEQWLATGGVRAGLAADSDTLSLIASFPAENLEVAAFAQRLRGFSRFAADWRKLIAAWPAATGEEETVVAARDAALDYLIRI
jgi:hypothetical protein